MFLLEVGGADLDGEAAGDLGHGGEEGKGAGAVAHGLVGDAGDLVGEEGVGELAERCEVEVGEEDEAGAEVGIFLGDGLFDLDDHVGGAPDAGGVGDDFSADGLVFGVGEGGQGSCAGFDEDLVAGVDKGFGAGWGYAYAAFVVFDFLGDADDHA